jgi:hypothetical protein
VQHRVKGRRRGRNEGWSAQIISDLTVATCVSGVSGCSAISAEDG